MKQVLYLSLFLVVMGGCSTTHSSEKTTTSSTKEASIESSEKTSVSERIEELEEVIKANGPEFEKHSEVVLTDSGDPVIAAKDPSSKNESQTSDTKSINEKLGDIRKKQERRKKEYRLQSDTGKQSFKVQLKGEWKAYPDPEELVEGFNASFHLNQSAYGGIAIMEAMDFENYEAFKQLSYESFDIPDDSEQKEIKTGDIEGTRYIFSERQVLLKLKYAIYIVKYDDFYLEMELWSPASQFDQMLETGEQLLLSIEKEE